MATNNNSVFGSEPSDTNTEINPEQFADIKVDTLVGEGKKYKDPDELAKAYAHSDAFIAQLKAERTEEKARIKVLEDMLKARQESNPEGNSPNSEQQQRNPADGQEPENRRSPEENKDNSEKDLESRLEEFYRQQKEKETFTGNVDAAAKRLAEKFGSEAEAGRFVRDKAKELQVPVDWLMDMAGKSPAALYRTLGIEGVASQNSPNSSANNSVNGNAFRNGSDTSKRNFRYYEEIRKNNPKAYWERSTQSQMMEDARQQGEAFYKNS